MNRLYYVFACFLFISQSYAQSVTITPGTSEPSIDAQTTLNGVKVPMMSTFNRKKIANPAMGLMVFDTDLKALYLYNGNNWMRLAITADDTPSVIELVPDYTPIEDYSFGQSIAYDSPYLVVGDPVSNKVTVWKKNNAKFEVDTVLVPTNNIQLGDEWFGKSVSIGYDGSTRYIAVGHPKKKYNASSFPEHGTVHIYKLNSNTWTYQTSIYPPSTATGDWFGYSVSLVRISTGVLVLWAGAPLDNLDISPNTADVGATFVYVKDAGINWIPKHKFQDATANASNRMGNTVSARGYYAASGAPGNNGNSGAVYAYKYNNGTTNYDLLSKIVPTDVASNDFFGTGLAVRNDVMIVGSPNADVSGKTDQGKAYTFDLEYSTNNYDEEIYFDPDGEAYDHFGSSVGLDYSSFVVGTPDRKVNTLSKAGVVIQFTPLPGSPDAVRTLTEVNAKKDAYFGTSVLLTEDSEIFASSFGGPSNKGQISIIK